VRLADELAAVAAAAASLPARLGGALSGKTAEDLSFPPCAASAALACVRSASSSAYLQQRTAYVQEASSATRYLCICQSKSGQLLHNCTNKMYKTSPQQIEVMKLRVLQLTEV